MDTSAEAPAHEPITLTRFILDQEHKHPEATGDLTLLMNAIQTACKVIASAVRKAGIAGLYGMEVGAGTPMQAGSWSFFLCVAVLGWSPGPTTPLVPRCHWAGLTEVYPSVCPWAWQGGRDGQGRQLPFQGSGWVCLCVCGGLWRFCLFV
jgi:hypothetical protein